MGRPKSFLAGLSIDRAIKSHNCQHDSGHRIRMGDARLKVRVERSFEHYCLACAKRFLEADIARTQALLQEISRSESGSEDPPKA